MKLTKGDLVLLGVIIYFTFIGGTFYSQFNFFLRVANQIIVTALLGFWLAAKLRRKEGLPRTYLDLALGLYLLANLLGAVLGYSPRFSLEAIWYLVVHLLGFYLLVDLVRRGWTQKLTWAFFMASAVVCLVGLAEYLAWYVGTPLFADFSQGWLEIGGWRQPIPPTLYRLNITLNGSTPLAGYLALLIPPALGLVLSLRPADQNRQALLVWLGLAFIVLILTFARVGLLSLAISLPLTAIGWLRVSGRDRADLWAYWARLAPFRRVMIVLVGVVILTVALFWLERGYSRGLRTAHFRFTLWEAALTIFKAEPLSGAGPANFGRALLRLNNSAFPRQQIATAHNAYFNTAAQLGLMGLIAGGYLGLMVALSWRRRWQQTSEPGERIRLAACGAALASLAGQFLVDTYTATPNILIILALAAYLVGGVKRTPAPTRRPYALYAALAALLIYAAGFAWLTPADFHFQNSFWKEGAGKLNQAAARAAQAQRIDPYLTLRTFRLALLEARLAVQSGDQQALRAAIDHYQAGLQQEPILGLNSANLAGLLWQQGRHAEAIETLERTTEAEADPLYLVNLGYFYEQRGDWSQAGAAYGRALSLAPDLAASGFWQAAPARAERWPDFVQAAARQISPDKPLRQTLLRVNLALAREDFETAKTLIKPVSPTADARLQAALAEIYLNEEQPERAAALLDPAPKSARDYVLWGRIRLLQAGQAAASTAASETEAEKLLKTAVFLGNREAYYYLGQLYERQDDLQAAETAYRRGFSPHATSENVPVTLYGRFGGNDLAPQLLRIRGDRTQIKSWLALARLYEEQQRFKQASLVYNLLLAEDPYLQTARERLDLLAEKSAP